MTDIYERCQQCGYLDGRCQCAGGPFLPKARYGWGQAPHGTASGARRHYKRGEKPCEECKRANRQAKTQATGGAGAQTPEIREIRNGLPEFVPYKYRGTGKDTLTGYLTDAQLAEAEIEAVGRVRLSGRDPVSGHRLGPQAPALAAGQHRLVRHVRLPRAHGLPAPG